jgi:hypothetical protein
MTLNELARTLPNGFHDSAVHMINLDYSKHEIIFSIAVWVGDLSATDDETREAYRMGHLTLSDMAFCVIEPPDPTYPYYEKDRIVVDTDEVKSLRTPPSVQLPSVPEGMFLNWIYVNQWNSFIYVAARNAELVWDNGDK